MAFDIFSQKRMDRCARMQQEIMRNWHDTNAFTYTVHATDSVEGISLDDLRTRYFAVGVGESVTEIPIADMLVIFSIIEQQVAALRNRPKTKEKEFTVTYRFTTEFSDDDAVRLLSQIRIETPSEKGSHLHISVRPRTVAPELDS